MDAPNPTFNYLGLGKTLFNSSASLLVPDGERPDISLILSERILRKKNSGAWPEAAIQKLSDELSKRPTKIAENRDVLNPLHKEQAMDATFPFFDYLKSKGMEAYSRHLNPEVQFLTHHRCHAMAATLVSPFDKALVIVLDGAGTRFSDFPPDSEEAKLHPPSRTNGKGESVPHEECSVYLLDRKENRPQLQCVMKRWGTFVKTPESSKHFSEGIGIFYETVSEFIFDCSRSAGKVMGLAPFGEKREISGSLVDFTRLLPWEKAFSKGSKWEDSDLSFYKDLAATAQHRFEENLFDLVSQLRRKYPEYSRLILTGGCALNCTFNGKLQRQGMFDEIYIPPFPGDESIGLGAAAHLYFNDPTQPWHPLEHDLQGAYFGPKSSIPDEKQVQEAFGPEFQIEKPNSITEHCADILKQGHVIAWFQGRSESGPRALGNRSLLARPDRPGLKDFLNSHIKFRESFRPYGASCTYDKAHIYFDAPENFRTPYMAFAIPTRPAYREQLGEVTHVDGTCRYQSVHPGQNKLFFELIEAFGRKTDLYCLLNTSFNVMGEPIVETVEDALNFLKNMNQSNPAPIHGLAIGDFYIRARGH